MFSTGEVFMFSVIGVLVSACTFLLSLLAAELGSDGGRPGSLLGSAILGVVFAAFGYALSSIDHDLAPHAVLVTIGVFAFCFVPGIIYVVFAGPSIQRAVADAPDAAEFALRYFDTLDVNGDGDVNRGDLEKATAGSEWSARQRELLKNLASNWNLVGHEIGSTSSSGVMIIGGAIYPTSSTTTIYAFNRDDLKTYPDRLRKKYRRWL